MIIIYSYCFVWIFERFFLLLQIEFTCFERIIKYYTQCFTIGLGICHMRKGEYDKSKEYFNKLLSLVP